MPAGEVVREGFGEMRCPYCQEKGTKVIETRETEDEITRRRRECESCGKRFTTYEKVETLSITVVKKNHDRVPYDREKLMASVRIACQKRPIPADRIVRLVDAIEAELRQKKSDEVESREIGELVMHHLKDLDEVAYIRFASVYRKFADLRAFEDEFHKLVKEKETIQIPKR